MGDGLRCEEMRPPLPGPIKSDSKTQFLFYQLLFYLFINTVVFTSIIDVNIIPKLSNT